MIITREQKRSFREFVRTLPSLDTVAIVAHAKCPDGMISTLLLEDIILTNASGRTIRPHIYFKEYSTNLFVPLAEECRAKGIRTVFVLDLGGDNCDPNGFEVFWKQFEVFFIDHHPGSSQFPLRGRMIKAPSTDCTAWLVYQLGEGLFERERFKREVAAAMVGEFSHEDAANVPFIRESFPEFSKATIEGSAPMEMSARWARILGYFKEDTFSAYELVRTENEQELSRIDALVQREFKDELARFEKEAAYDAESHLFVYSANLKYINTSYLATTLSIRHTSDIILLCSPGKGGTLKLSSRGQSGQVDLNIALKHALSGIPNSNGGGHAKAAGGIVPQKDFSIFLSQFKEYLREHY
jgi:oligoribonuclease NrnB/cAMP/cGMP phosphodiesterase (DHH superfamily)